jgi:uncharacterized protein with beta-barrel porin domain
MRLRAAILAILSGAIGAASAQGATFNVSTTSDTGAGSLRQAVIDANDSADASNTITFTASIPANSTITLASPLEDIAKATLIFDATAVTNLTIDGPGANFLTFTTSSTSAQFHANSRFTDGTLTFAESDTGTITGILRDGGGALTVIKTGAGTTTLPAGSAITLTGSGSEVRIDQGTFDVDGNLTAASLPVASGGTLIVDVGGTVAVTGTVTDQGTIFANGTLTAGTLIIDSQGRLLGDAGSVMAPVTVLGRVAPSTTTGSLSIQGPVSFEPSSTFEVDIGPGNAGDSLAVTNAVTIQPGAQLLIVADPTAFGTSSTVTVLTASGISGQFTSTDYAFLDETLNYQPTSLTVTLTPTGQSFSSFASTPNQAAVATLLDAAAPTATGDLQTVFDSLNTALASEIPTLLDAIGGESLTAFATARQILGERTARALHRRTRDPAWGSGRAFYLSPIEEPDVAADGDEPPRDLVRAGAWLDGIGLFGELEGDTGEADVDTLLYGGTLGADVWIADRVVLGLAAGYARSDVDLEDREADVFGDTIQGALYAGFIDPRGYVSGYGRYAYTYQSSDRRIETSGILRKAHAHWDAHDYGAGGEAGITVVSFRGFALQPIAGVDWLRLTEEDYTESGAGSLGLIVDPETLDTTTARFGGRVFGQIDMGDVGELAPELRAFYQRAWGDRERALDARLIGAPGLSAIGVRGPELPRESLILGLGWGVRVGGNLTVSFDYDAVLGSDRVEHQGNVAVRALF